MPKHTGYTKKTTDKEHEWGTQGTSWPQAKKAK